METEGMEKLITADTKRNRAPMCAALRFLLAQLFVEDSS
jgi:hypothetical protein